MPLNIHLLIPELVLLSFIILMVILDFFVRDKRQIGVVGVVGTVVTGLALILVPKKGSALMGLVIQDPAAVFFKFLFLIVALSILYMAILYDERIKHWKGEFYILILFAILGMMFLASAYDFITLFVSLELMAVSLYILATYMKDDTRSIEAGFKYLVTGALASGFLLYGISFLYGYTGYTGFEEVAGALGQGRGGFLTLGLFLVILGLTFKLSSIPFYIWAPDVYEGSPTPVTALIAAGSKTAGFVVAMRLLFTVLGPVKEEWIGLVVFLSGATILLGNLAAMPQKNIKRMLAYAGIGSAGYLLIGIAAASILGAEAMMFYLLTYIFAIIGSFLAIVIFSRVSGSDSIDAYIGLSRRSPLLAATLFIGLLSLAGVPPLGGFIAKFYIFAAAVKEGLIGLAVVGVVMAIVSMYYFLLVVKRMYLIEPEVVEPIELNLLTRATLYGVNIVTILLGIYPGPFTDWLMEVAKDFF